MSESRQHERRSEQVIAVRFRMKASSDEVVAHLLEAVRGTDLSLLMVFGDGDPVYPHEVRSASSWRAELFWRSRAINAGWHLEAFLARAEFFLGLRDRVQLELGGGQRNPREDVQNPA